MTDRNTELDPQIIRTALGQNETASAEAQRAAFIKLYLHYEARVRYAVATAAMRTRCRHRAADIRQDVWYRLCTPKNNPLNYYDPERGTFGSFISRLTYHLVINIAQSSTRRKTQNVAQFETINDDEADVESPLTLQAYAELIQTEFYDKLMERAAAALDYEEHLILQEIYFGGRSVPSFAAARGINKNTIYKRHQRLKDKLYKFSTELLDEGTLTESDKKRVSLGAISGSLALSLMEDTHKIGQPEHQQSLTIIAHDGTDATLTERFFSALKAVAQNHPKSRDKFGRQDSARQ